MKKLLVWVLMIVMTLMMFLPTGFAAESTPFKERTPVLRSISADEFGTVTLEWKGVDGAYQYGVYRKKVSDTSWVRIGMTQKTSYKNFNAKLNTQYQYTVRAFKKDTDIYTKRDPEGLKITPKRKVLGLTSVKNIGIEAIRLEWKKLSGNVKYCIARKENGGEWKWIKNVTGAQTWTDTTVKNGKKYYYRIIAEKTVEGKEYVTAYDKTGSAIICNNKATVELESIRKGLNAATVTWKKMVGADCYYVYRKTTDGTWTYLATAKGTSYTDENLKNGKKYYYTVCGVKKKAGQTLVSWRDLDGISTYATVKSAPEMKSAENAGFEAVTVKWNRLAGADSYRVFRKVPGGEYQLLKSGITGTSYTDKTAKNGKTYIYSVSAYRKQDGNGYYSQKAEGLQIKSAPAESVKLSGITRGFIAAKISWKEVPGAESYHVLRKEKGGSWQRIASYVSGTSYTDENQKWKKTYSYSVRAVKKTSSGETILTGYDKTGISATAVIPNSVEMKSAEMLRFRTAKVTWKPVMGADGYYVYRRTSGGEWKWLADVTGTQYTDRTPEMDRKYYYTVGAYRVVDGKKMWSGKDDTGIGITLESVIDPDKPMVALTYDDGPGKYTEEILDVFEKYDAHATFFVVGRNAAKRPETLKRAYDLGCEIGNHSYTHPALTSISNSEIDSEIGRTDNAIKNAIGIRSELLRPPYGADSERVCDRVDKPFIEWSVDTLDWKHRSASKNLSCVKKNVKDGSIVLMHDIHKCTADSAENIVSYLKNKGYQLVTVSELAYYKGYNMKDGKVYHSFY